ncbi:MAG: hypothetical protein EGS50_10835 [Alistipes senegalensis]|nr:hypothetical protein [Alistipes senegalensis]
MAWGFESLYPHKGAFFEAPFFVGTQTQNKAKPLYINKLIRLASIPTSATKKYFAENLRVAIWWQRGQIGSQASRLPPFLLIMH